MRAAELPRSLTLNTFVNDPTIKNWPVAKGCTLERHEAEAGFESRVTFGAHKKSVYLGLERLSRIPGDDFPYRMGASLVYNPNEGDVEVVPANRDDRTEYAETVSKLEQAGWTVIPTDLNQVIGYRAKLRIR